MGRISAPPSADNTLPPFPSPSQQTTLLHFPSLLIRMELELQPLECDRDLYTEGRIDEIIYTSRSPRVLLSSRSSSETRQISIVSELMPNAESNKLVYAGSTEHGMCFYVQKKGWILYQNFLLIRYDIRESTFTVLRETETPHVRFLHRQPYYLIKPAIFPPFNYTVCSFDGNRVEIPWDGIIVDDANSLFLYNNEKVCIISKASTEVRRKTGNIVRLYHPDVDGKCTAFSDPNEPVLYIALSKLPVLMTFDIDTLALEMVQLPKVLDIRYVHRGQLIFYDPAEKGLFVAQLEVRYWMSKLQLQVQLQSALKGLENAEDGQHIAREEYAFEEAKRLATEEANARIRMERDAIEKRMAELEKKYRKMLLLLGRQQSREEAE
ncbi:hypothetical protein PMAYCL1PPCAC_11536 [Pristionchus mayeri]|uniref:Uncharacterized protein n=1 Tax=Pristionchus mayeri TaxID=1317129 RepID=A0AAN4ZIB4_9BILA|nr:hypothetical protein PMAYCL1PPCAC_11536 [Pristionchus mayeri]